MKCHGFLNYPYGNEERLLFTRPIVKHNELFQIPSQYDWGVSNLISLNQEDSEVIESAAFEAIIRRNVEPIPIPQDIEEGDGVWYAGKKMFEKLLKRGFVIESKWQETQTGFVRIGSKESFNNYSDKIFQESKKLLKSSCLKRNSSESEEFFKILDNLDLEENSRKNRILYELFYFLKLKDENRALITLSWALISNEYSDIEEFSKAYKKEFEEIPEILLEKHSDISTGK